ncbi:uncharacterized protein TRIREDRAFT_103715 [Trichoderma reesei QM6a]|uniref:Predicted protein n=2 Tax=Hypocrea jecorina TaxID=51453 RepID=G0R9M7_HYPJQ|nr:uncharacterized protein TRIREDRAFT_103715 [Trichoderma reesei QM6a]EGR51718.1 predicted protein [Trichoderma reesei QM6a]ETS05404.1 hypothetical protein M419DRAFT_71512 [Trichoderma reesei RUT C-30]
MPAVQVFNTTRVTGAYDKSPHPQIGSQSFLHPVAQQGNRGATPFHRPFITIKNPINEVSHTQENQVSIFTTIHNPKLNHHNLQIPNPYTHKNATPLTSDADDHAASQPASQQATPYTLHLVFMHLSFLGMSIGVLFGPKMRAQSLFAVFLTWIPNSPIAASYLAYLSLLGKATPREKTTPAQPWQTPSRSPSVPYLECKRTNLLHPNLSISSRIPSRMFAFKVMQLLRAITVHAVQTNYLTYPSTFSTRIPNSCNDLNHARLELHRCPVMSGANKILPTLRVRCPWETQHDST